ncbi:hypothetical protein P775_11080 [Puniceibacterium antarcticum]|uniref:Uncharacterized protein n=1 Tax=Puniceibacterium antarcticum TaxID=1206336 RepID=A0A2G8RF35_9RHOB|nr:hypothetical protein [Puniceibacterium antarcticum]PIL20204.1 hypothetical protein P775_11080 [Puniceibacterium antarcticum]
MDTPLKLAKFEVTLIAPAKIDRVWQPEGAIVWVTPKVASQLFEAGAISGTEGEVLIGDEVDVAFETLVDARAEKIANGIVAAAVDTAMSGLTAEKDKALAQAEAANARAEKAEARITELEGELADLRKPDAAPEPTPEQNTPPSEGAKTTRRGAAPTKKG